MRNKEIELDLGVDPHRLDEGWTQQPSIYFRYAAKLAGARQELDRAKTELDLVDAELDIKIRKNPELFDLPKVTESVIKSTIVVAGVHIRANDFVMDAKHAVDILAAAVTALDHKKKALENMVSLQLANYYSSPKAPEGAKDRMDEVSKRSIRRRGRKGSE